MIPAVEDADALQVARVAARAGGRVALERLGKPGYISWKGHRDPVTGSTMEVQDAIVRVLRENTPEHGILTEEGPEDESIPTDAEHLWIVDPICGSLNYAQGIPYFAVSIGWRSRGNIRAGVVYDPCRDELFAATHEGAVTLNGAAVGVEQIAEGYEAFEKSWLGMDWPASGKRRDDTFRVVAVMAPQVTSLTAMGSPALGLCNVAAGRLHAYWHLDLRIWDIAAASVILRRAGGTLTDSTGASWLHGNGGYIASNSIIHGWTLRCLQQTFEADRRASTRPQPMEG